MLLQGKRLCTQQEWSLACRSDPAGGADSTYAYGDELDLARCNTNKPRPDPPPPQMDCRSVKSKEMAVFVIRAKLNLTPGQDPPHNPIPFFQDAPLSHPYFTFIQKMKELGVTMGCSATMYCPDATTTRGQMAVPSE